MTSSDAAPLTNGAKPLIGNRKPAAARLIVKQSAGGPRPAWSAAIDPPQVGGTRPPERRPGRSAPEPLR